MKQKMSLTMRKREKSSDTKKKTRGWFFFLNFSEISFFTVVSFAQTSFLFPEKSSCFQISFWTLYFDIFFLWFFPKRPFCKSSSFFFSMKMTMFLKNLVPLVFGRLFRFHFSSLSVKPLQLFFSFLFRLFLAFFNLVLSKNNLFLRTKYPFQSSQKMFSDFLLG